jgi:hypothetical protein
MDKTPKHIIKIGQLELRFLIDAEASGRKV